MIESNKLYLIRENEYIEIESYELKYGESVCMGRDLKIVLSNPNRNYYFPSNHRGLVYLSNRPRFYNEICELLIELSAGDRYFPLDFDYVNYRLIRGGMFVIDIEKAIDGMITRPFIVFEDDFRCTFHNILNVGQIEYSIIDKGLIRIGDEIYNLE